MSIDFQCSFFYARAQNARAPLSMLSAPLSGDTARIPARKPPICDFFALSSGLYARYIFPKVKGPAGTPLYGRHGQVNPLLQPLYAERALDNIIIICYNYKKNLF